MKINYLLIYISLLACKHPESKVYERNQGENIKAKKVSFDENNISDSEPITLSPEMSYLENKLNMEIQDGVRFVWIEINGIKLRFIFDTGASNICISPAEATVLYRQGTLREEDVLNQEFFQDATGKISEGTTINLREVRVGNKVLNNVKALVVDNVNAPLLLGQTVLERFGSIEIDNLNMKIKFK